MLRLNSQVVILAGAAAAVSACSGGNTTRHVLPTDAGAGGSPLHDSGAGGKGGKGGGGAGGTAGSGGGGTGGVLTDGGGGRDASVADVFVPADTGTAIDASDAPSPLVCNTPSIPDGSITPEAGPYSGEWRDFAKHRCVACPGLGATCSDFLESASSYDPATRRMTMVLGASVAEIVSGTVTLSWDAFFPDGGYRYGQVTVPVAVSGNTLTADLSADLPVDVVAVYAVRATLRDACGSVTFANFGIVSDGGDAAKPSLNLHCEF